jgi:flagellar biogenesis protein FliO
MDSMQQAAAVLLVLVLLGATLYGLRGKGLNLVFTRRVAGANQRLLQSLERLPLTPQHSLHLVRVEDRTILVAVSPHGCSILNQTHLDQTRAGSPYPQEGLVR